MKINYWCMADTHFGHHKLIYEGYRPSECYNRMINSVKILSEKDVLIHLGDFSFYNDEYWHREFMNACKCKKWLIKGNHDGRTNSWYLSHGWDFIADKIHMKLFGKDIVFSHVPISLTGKTENINVHGHLHNCIWRDDSHLTDRHILVKIEHDYKPVNLKKLIRM